MHAHERECAQTNTIDVEDVFKYYFAKPLMSNTGINITVYFTSADRIRRLLYLLAEAPT